jgi:hypothetical protein
VAELLEDGRQHRLKVGGGGYAQRCLRIRQRQAGQSGKGKEKPGSRQGSHQDSLQDLYQVM